MKKPSSASSSASFIRFSPDGTSCPGGACFLPGLLFHLLVVEDDVNLTITHFLLLAGSSRRRTERQGYNISALVVDNNRKSAAERKKDEEKK